MLAVLYIITKVLFVAVFFSLCILVHEMGHLLAGVWQGLHVEKFSIGFWKRIWGFTYKGIDFVVSVLPFGGYVMLPQLEPSDQPMTSDGQVLPRATPVRRALTALAGPAANIVFGLFLGLFVMLIGVERPAPATYCDVWRVPKVLPLFKDGLKEGDRVVAVDGERVTGSWMEIVHDLPASTAPVELTVSRDGDLTTLSYTPVLNPEYQGKLRPGDRIVGVNGTAFDGGWDELYQLIILNTGDLTLDVIREGEPVEITYTPHPNPLADGLGYPFFSVYTPVVVGSVMPGSPAETAGLQTGDRLLRIDGERVPNAGGFIETVAQSEGRPLDLEIRRAGETITIRDVQARPEVIDGRQRYLIGIGITYPTAIAHPNPFQQLYEVFDRTRRTLRPLVAPLTGQRSLVKAKHLSGPLGIIYLIWHRITMQGFMGGLSFVIFVNFSLAFLNLLPIPVLDGGHVLYAVVEIVTRRRIPIRIVYALQNAFAVLLIGFMVYVTVFDARRIPKFWRASQPAEEEEASAVEDVTEPFPTPRPEPDPESAVSPSEGDGAEATSP